MNKIQDSKETYWSKFADDFEERNNYVIGASNLQMIYTKLSNETHLGTVLELGCGNGTFTKVISPNAHKIIATDYSDEMVAKAQSRLHNFSHIEFQKENCFALSFEAQSFDTIFMANLLHIIPQPEHALQECHRVLKKGGRLIIISYTTEGLRFFDKLKLMYRFKKTYGTPSPTSYKLTPALACTLVKKQNFHVNHCELIGNSMKAVLLTAHK